MVFLWRNIRRTTAVVLRHSRNVRFTRLLPGENAAPAPAPSLRRRRSRQTCGDALVARVLRNAGSKRNHFCWNNREFGRKSDMCTRVQLSRGLNGGRVYRSQPLDSAVSLFSSVRGEGGAGWGGGGPLYPNPSISASFPKAK